MIVGPGQGMTEDLQVSMKVPWFVIARRAVLNKLFVVPGGVGGGGEWDWGPRNVRPSVIWPFIPFS